jgi:hypothetical protein
VANPNVLQQVLNWLRAGYPAGIPREDYVALFAVLHRKLTDAEIQQIASELATDANANSDNAIGRTDIEAAIAGLAKETPAEADISRVASRLAAGGWPLAQPS